MIDDEPASGYNLPPGCFDKDIERAFGAERRYCSECKHYIESDELDCCICGLKLKDAIAKLQGAQRRSPKYIIAAVEDSIVPDDGYYADDCCKWEEE